MHTPKIVADRAKGSASGQLTTPKTIKVTRHERANHITPCLRHNINHVLPLPCPW